MATKNKFRELNLGPSEPITRRNSVAGMQVIADYLDAITGQRTLHLKRIEVLGATALAPKLKQTRKRKAKAGTTNSKTPQQEYNDMKAADEDYEASVARG